MYVMQFWISVSVFSWSFSFSFLNLWKMVTPTGIAAARRPKQTFINNFPVSICGVAINRAAEIVSRASNSIAGRKNFIYATHGRPQCNWLVSALRPQEINVQEVGLPFTERHTRHMYGNYACDT